MRRIFLSIGVIWFLLGSVIIQPSIAQNKVVVIPLHDEKENYSPVEITGQTDSNIVWDDGWHKMGVAWPNPRFTDNLDGTVTDNLTGLIWLKNTNCFGERPWNEQVPLEGNAVWDCLFLQTGNCGLSDGSTLGQWRLPNVKELQSLLDYGHLGPNLPSDHPFLNIQSNEYWSSTTVAFAPDVAYSVSIWYGFTSSFTKDNTFYVWPVRGGN